ncbi:MAG TPA: hypothetical protein DEG43_10985 [Acidimicrobiaceae bacterium]|nr:hypothetical protein [Acidimicrobiaceae bacterium]
MSSGSMFTVERQDNSLRYEECRTSATARSVCLFFSLLSVVSLVAVAITTVWVPVSAGQVMSGVTVLAFGAFAVLAAAIGLAPPQRLAFDRVSRRVKGNAQQRWGISRRVDVAFSELGTPLVRGIERELAGPLYQVRIEVTDKAPLNLGAFDDREEAERFCEQLCEAVARKD